MKILYTKHALGKFKSLRLIGWKLKKVDVKSVINFADDLSEDKDRGVKIALKEIDKDHNLRVIYTENRDIINIVTFYPTEKGRYENT